MNPSGRQVHANIINAVFVCIIIDLAADAVHASLRVLAGLIGLSTSKERRLQKSIAKSAKKICAGA